MLVVKGALRAMSQASYIQYSLGIRLNLPNFMHALAYSKVLQDTYVMHPRVSRLQYSTGRVPSSINRPDIDRAEFG